MFERIILWLFAVLYAGLGVWCTARPETTARAVGFDLRGGSGRSEYLVVYGGLELALGVFFAVTALVDEHRGAGLLLALISSAVLAAYRTWTVFTIAGIERTTYWLFASELTLTALAAVALWSHVGARS